MTIETTETYFRKPLRCLLDFGLVLATRAVFSNILVLKELAAEIDFELAGLTEEDPVIEGVSTFRLLLLISFCRSHSARASAFDSSVSSTKVRVSGRP